MRVELVVGYAVGLDVDGDGDGTDHVLQEGEESDEEEAAGEDEKVLLAKTLLSKSMWGPADIQELEKTGLLMPSEEPTAFSSVRARPMQVPDAPLRDAND